MRIPQATYRLQFSPKFGFKQAERILDYLAELGISDIYASPIFKAKSGSLHGYDITDPNQLNPELGSNEDFESLIQSCLLTAFSILAIKSSMLIGLGK